MSNFQQTTFTQQSDQWQAAQPQVYSSGFAQQQQPISMANASQPQVVIGQIPVVPAVPAKDREKLEDKVHDLAVERAKEQHKLEQQSLKDQSKAATETRKLDEKALKDRHDAEMKALKERQKMEDAQHKENLNRMKEQHKADLKSMKNQQKLEGERLKVEQEQLKEQEKLEKERLKEQAKLEKDRHNATVKTEKEIHKDQLDSIKHEPVVYASQPLAAQPLPQQPAIALPQQQQGFAPAASAGEPITTTVVSEKVMVQQTTNPEGAFRSQQL